MKNCRAVYCLHDTVQSVSSFFILHSSFLILNLSVMTYRNLTEDEVLRLKSQSCLADDWGKVTVAEGFSTEFVHHTRFSGEVCLGIFHSGFTLTGGIKEHSGLRHVTLHNVTVGDDCCIENIQNYIANYEIGHDTFIENVDIILVDGLSKFGNGVEVSVLNETGGRTYRWK